MTFTKSRGGPIPPTLYTNNQGSYNCQERKEKGFLRKMKIKANKNPCPIPIYGIYFYFSQGKLCIIAKILQVITTDRLLSIRVGRIAVMPASSSSR